MLLQYLATFLIAQFAGNAAAGLFGPVITLMLFFNIFARLILFVAAWIATHDEPAFPEQEDEAGPSDADDQTAVRFVLPQPAADLRPAMVSQAAATRSVSVGLGLGYATGAATGVGSAPSWLRWPAPGDVAATATDAAAHPHVGHRPERTAV